MSLLEELKALSVHLSPSHRVAGSEVADVLGALIGYAEHGQPIIDAAHQGPQALYDFWHDHLTQLAVSNGDEPPVKGQPLQHVPEAGRFGPPPAVSHNDFQELKSLVQQLLSAQGVTPAASEPAPLPLTPDQLAAVARAQQTVADAEALAHDQPESD